MNEELLNALEINDNKKYKAYNNFIEFKYVKDLDKHQLYHIVIKEIFGLEAYVVRCKTDLDQEFLTAIIYAKKKKVLENERRYRLEDLQDFYKKHSKDDNEINWEPKEYEV